jgi:dolichol kinase
VVNDWLKKKDIVSQYFTRKVIHVVAGPALIVSFIFYSGMWYSPYIALVAPLLFAFLFLLIGTGMINNNLSERFIQSMSRSGDPKELMRGTFYYCLVGVSLTLISWTSIPLKTSYSPMSIVIAMTLAFGDGFADIVGRKINRMKFKIIAEKSVPGSLAMFLTSVITCFITLAIFGYDLIEMGLLTLIVILIATIIEALSPRETDNITIPMAIVITMVILSPLLVPSATWSLFYIHLP